MNEVLKKILDSISPSKEHWVVILFGLFLISSISGTIYIEALFLRIESLEDRINYLKDEVKYHQDDKKDIIERHQLEINQVTKRVEYKMKSEFFEAQYESVKNSAED